MVLFFGLVFPVAPLENFSADALAIWITGRVESKIFDRPVKIPIFWLFW